MWDNETTVMTLFAVAIGLLGLCLAGNAHDLGFELFGLGLVGFAVVYVVTTIRRVY